MTCQECEIKLGMGEDAAEHLASCEACRWLAEELRLNAGALREMRVRPRMRWEWALAAAAVAMAIGVWQIGARGQRPGASEMAPPALAAGSAPRVEVPPAVKHVRRRIKRPEPAETLRVKMFTSDPDVVIYWIVDRKVGSE